MARPQRKTVTGMAYHVLNRRVMRLSIFDKSRDYQAFERVLAEGLRRPDALGLLAYCLMPNHWHLVLWPKAASNLSTWMQWLTVTHTHRWHQHYHSLGQGPLYQGRFKSFPIQEDGHLLTVMRYVEANALRAGLVEKAEAWRWGSPWVRQRGSPEQRAMLCSSPVELPADWGAIVNTAKEMPELEQVRQSVIRSAPLGEKSWVDKVVKALGLEGTQRRRGRPKKPENRVTELGNAS
jgi:putative transposase